DKQPEPKSKTTPGVRAANAATASSKSNARPDITPSVPFRFPAPERLVAFGDVHGDFAATRKVLQMAQVVDEAGHWNAGKLVVVQTGDQLDRGDDERKILDYFEALREEAKKAGGAFHVLLGNHETMNAMADFRYVTQGGFKAFDDVEESGVPEAVIGRFPESARGRARALLPGGKYAALLAKRNTVLIVGDSLFVHGGVLPEHLDYGLGRLNQEVRDWLVGKRSSPPAIIAKDDAPVWVRDYSEPESGKANCKRLGEVLDRLELKRMVVGHTVQSQGVTEACSGRVWRIDVGLATYYGGPTQALEIRGDTVTVLK
ncbi:MAG: metallophosphoesterase, partial [Myxococcales bacterium]|nr:metallophosphoesterase [Myxococcales bacterium]